MRIVAVIALTTAAVAVAGAAKLPPPMRLVLVPAQCNALPPATPGPCSAMTFASGQVVMKPIREPQPTCPKTGQPTEAPGGDILLRGVAKGGAPFDGQLAAQANLKTTFGDDPNGNCELHGVQVSNSLSLQGTLTCKKGTCRGTIYPIACLPKTCADTPVVSELGSVQVNAQSFGPVVVFDDADNPLATPGTTLTPSREP